MPPPPVKIAAFEVDTSTRIGDFASGLGIVSPSRQLLSTETLTIEPPPGFTAGVVVQIDLAPESRRLEKQAPSSVAGDSSGELKPLGLGKGRHVLQGWCCDGIEGTKKILRGEPVAKDKRAY